MTRIISSEKVILFFYFLSLILLGSILLYLPDAWGGEEKLSYIDALFTSVSAVCVTGLITVDTATYTFFGKLVILLLIQFGGLGIITFTTVFLARPSGRLPLSSRKITGKYYLEEIEHHPFKIIRNIFIFTIVFETVGAILLLQSLNLKTGDGKVFNAIFHSISAFCNAGFSLYSNSLEGYIKTPSVNIVIMILIISGGIGFLVIQDLSRRITNVRHKLSFHTKIVLSVTIALIISGTIGYFLFENNGLLKNLSTGEKLLTSLFQSVTPRTAGFNTLPQAELSTSSKILTLPLMFIGGAPGSIAGGIKVTTFFLVLTLALVGVDERGELRVGNRKVNAKLLTDATVFAVKAIMILFTSVFLLTITEHIAGRKEGSRFLEILFESFSAFGTVGLSLGVTPELTLPGKGIIIFTMFAGRVGLISMAMPLPDRQIERVIDYPEGEVMIG